MWILRAVMFLALVVWVGAIIFFSFVVAPSLFTVLPTHMAGDVVSVALAKLHYIGLISGLLFLVCSITYNRAIYAQVRLWSAIHVLIVLMLVMTAVSQFAVTPRMRALRSSTNALQSPTTREEFNRLHVWSTQLEGGVLVCGLAVVILTSRRSAGLGQ